LGTVFVSYSSHLIVIQPPPVIGAAVGARSSFAGAHLPRPPHHASNPLHHAAPVVHVLSGFDIESCFWF
jgi:hypothetical protein